MKVLVKENLGSEFTANVISSCNQNRMQAIADYTNNEILFYDPENHLYARYSSLINDNDFDVFDLFKSENKNLRFEVMNPTEGEDFRNFAIEWNGFQSEESPDIIKTKNCSMIRMDPHSEEKEMKKISESKKPGKFKKSGKTKKDDGLSQDDLDFLDKLKNTDDKFGRRVNGIEAQVSEGELKGEYTVKIQWTRDFPKFGIIAGDSDEVKVRFSEIDALAHAHGGNGLDELIEEKMNEEYPGIGQLDYEDDYIIANEVEMRDYYDMYIGKERVYERFAANESTFSDGGMDDNVSEWYAERFPDDDLAGRINTQVTFQDAMDCIDYGADIYDLLGTFDSTIRERLFAELAARTGIEYGKLYRKWLKNSAFDESIDNRNDWSASEGEVEIMWDIDDYNDFGIYSGDTETFLIDYDLVDTHQDLVDEICKMIGKEYQDLYFEPEDFVITNEDEFWYQRGGNPGKLDDDLYTEGKRGKGFEVVEDIPDWASNYFLYKDETDLNDVDMKLIFDFVEKLKKQGLRLFEPIPGTENEYNDNPAFGYGTSTQDWYARKIVSEHNFMNESGSNGGTIDVTIKFTHGHYGKKLKAGDERTIKLDTSTAPTIYDTDDMLTWIADVASDQISGLGKVTKYDFETIDPPDDVLIKAVVGDEGFGPDVDVDFEDFDPEDVPSEISYKDALKFYRKMDDAYDERKLNYTKFDQIRNKLMDAVVKGLLKEKSLDELAEEWFINYGTMNGWGWKTSFKYNVACALHDIHKKKHPDEHVIDREDTIRGWHSEKCSCGLASSSDSSD